MAIKLDIITGFLGAGKTSFINHMLSTYISRNQKTLVVLCEQGERDILEKYSNHAMCFIEQIYESPLKGDTLLRTIEVYQPERIILECNGMMPLEDLFQILEEKKVRRLCRVDRIIHLIDASTFEQYSLNLGRMFVDPAIRSDTIILTHTGDLDKEYLQSIQKMVKQLNNSCERYEISTEKSLEESPVTAYLLEESKGGSNLMDKLVAVFLSFICIYLLMIVLRFSEYDLYNQHLLGLRTYFTLFLSILLQAFPFLLLGVIVSAFIQIFVPQDFMVKLFSKNRFRSMLIAVVAGVLFPICDCAIIPIMRQLIKKGIPVSVAITFLLAAPVVDPVVIASTLYAFPNDGFVAIYRVLLGIGIAVTAGSFFSLFPYKKGVILQVSQLNACQCGYCGNEYNKQRDFKDKVSGVIRHAGTEFFEVGKYLILGAAFSTLLHTNMPSELIGFLSNNLMGSMVVMMVLAFLLSICSTADAFIARSLLVRFDMGAVLGFMAFGAALDIKNLFMLLGSFQRPFVARLVTVIVVISFVLLILFTQVIKGLN